MSEPRLPPELIHCIMDHLFDDMPTLTSIRFTDRTFNLSCRRYIFRIVNLTTKSRIEKFQALLASSPSIVLFIKEFSLELEDHMFNHPGPKLNDTISNLLHQLTHIAVFDFGSEAITQWKDWPSAIRSAIKIPMSSPFLYSAMIFNIQGVLTSLFDACPTLEHLYILAITFEDNCPNGLQSRPYLQFLVIGSDDSDPLPRGIPADLTRLQYLMIRYPSPGSDGSWIWGEFIEPASKSLKTLDLTQLVCRLIRLRSKSLLTTYRRA